MTAQTTAGSWEPRVDEVADLLAWHVAGLSPTLGGGRLVCVDGPAGSGKTSLGRALADAAVRQGEATTVRLLHMDDVYEGWGGLAEAGPRLAADLVAPLRRGTTGGYRRYDWARGRFTEWVPVEPTDLLVLEGCGSGDSSYDEAITCLVWVEAPREVRVARGVTRDGEQVLAHWYAWMDDEQAVFSRERTRDRADVLVTSGADETAVCFT